ncbi:Metallo-dependent phosphatase-like protein [Catenaria anguillulae PL171]|uniref:Metallo-dependent phosphatase-like protein n=1 Tax=Catenaria anguillulae PL171 TaxID=765915 RepID=A0A1Y2HI34_9FUNG|nr:Metallo-dependent phosphatase-like protein [Catenaria anguillulae PL171]
MKLYILALLSILAIHSTNVQAAPITIIRIPFPWENPNRPGCGDYPGHIPGFHLPIFFPRPRPTTPPPCPSCVTFTGAENQTYVPGYGGDLRIARALPNDSKPFTMTLIHTNDLHTRYDEFSSSGIDCTDKNRAERRCYGGIARIKTLVDQIRATEPNTYMVDAGDQFQGNLFYNYYKGNVTAEFENFIGYDAVTIGNHEFDDGPAHLGQFLKKVNMPAISTNMDLSTEPTLKGLIAPYVVLTKYGTRIGLVGYITKTTSDISQPGKNIKFLEPSGATGPVQRAVDKLRSLGIKRIIAVSHNGLDDDKAVAASTRGISVIVGGHSHSLMHKNASLAGVRATYPLPIKNLDGQDTFIVQAKQWGEWVGKLQVSWDGEGNVTGVNGDPIQMTMDIAQHGPTQEMVKKWREPFDAIAREVIGTAPLALARATCVTQGCAIGYWIANILRKSYTGTRPAIGLQNVGGIRADLGAGDITIGTVFAIQPFPNAQVQVDVTGANIVAMLENVALTQNSDGLRADGKKVTSMAQFAGLRAKLDANQPKFARVSEVEVEVSAGVWEPLDATKQYAIVTIDFLPNGGDAILPPEIVGPQETRVQVSDMVIASVRQTGTVDIPEAAFAPGVRFV